MENIKCTLLIFCSPSLLPKSWDMVSGQRVQKETFVPPYWKGGLLRAII